jgi:hypothetical protein
MLSTGRNARQLEVHFYYDANASLVLFFDKVNCQCDLYIYIIFPGLFDESWRLKSSQKFLISLFTDPGVYLVPGEGSTLPGIKIISSVSKPKLKTPFLRHKAHTWLLVSIKHVKSCSIFF